jgi:hypothetical protein
MTVDEAIDGDGLTPTLNAARCAAFRNSEASEHSSDPDFPRAVPRLADRVAFSMKSASDA